jgi:ATP-dependent Clp protease adaptor protein ClpS
MSTDTDINIDEKIKQTVKEPSNYNVIMINDDATPMEWVIEILTKIFKHSETTAKNLTLTIHNEGAGIAGTYTYEIAEQKTTEAINASRDRGFPLKVKMDAE